MNTLLKAALGVCTAFVFMGAICLIMPTGAMKKSVSYCYSLAFLLIIIVPVISIGKLEIPNIQYEIPESQNTAALYSNAAQYLCAAALEDAGILFDNLTVNADICEDGSISINSVRVVSDCLRSEICSALSSLAPESVVEVVNE